MVSVVSRSGQQHYQRPQEEDGDGILRRCVSAVRLGGDGILRPDGNMGFTQEAKVMYVLITLLG